jgi:hypothetical protein
MDQSRRARNREIFEQWTSIQDIVGEAKKWPHRIRRLFWTKSINHFERLLVCAFVFVNGLNPLVFLDWVDLMGLARDSHSRKEMESLLKAFEDGKYPQGVYGYNVTMNYYQYLDGTKRFYTPAHLRK